MLEHLELFVRDNTVEDRKPLIAKVSAFLITAALFAPVVLKVFGLVDWSWLWAAAPLLILMALLTAIGVFGGVAYVGYLIFRAFVR